MQAHHAGNSATEKSDEPAGIDGQADAVKDPVDRFGALHQGGGQCQYKVESHASQRGDAGNVVPLGGLAVYSGEMVHLHGAQIIADQANAEDYKMICMQAMSPTAEYSPSVEGESKTHPDYAARHHNIVPSGVIMGCRIFCSP